MFIMNVYKCLKSSLSVTENLLQIYISICNMNILQLNHLEWLRSFRKWILGMINYMQKDLLPVVYCLMAPDY